MILRRKEMKHMGDVVKNQGGKKGQTKPEQNTQKALAAQDTK